jgi:hypothetical protein
MSESNLASKIKQLSPPAAAEALKNLRIALQHTWQHQVSEEQARQVLQSADVSGEAGILRSAILSDQGTIPPTEMERWAKSILLYFASDPELLPIVEQAVEDALQSSSKDFGISALITVGVIIVLLKWRPTTVQTGKDGFKITWKENDVSIVKDLIDLIKSTAPVLPTGGGQPPAA